MATSYWAAERDRATIERSILHSWPYAVYGPTGQAVGFARATSDLASFCWIGDVVVDENSRGIGIGSWLVAALVEHQLALGVPRFLLSTRDAHEVYARIGFTPLQVPAIWMEMDRRPNRPRPGQSIGRT